MKTLDEAIDFVHGPKRPEWEKHGPSIADIATNPRIDAIALSFIAGGVMHGDSPVLLMRMAIATGIVIGMEMEKHE